MLAVMLWNLLQRFQEKCNTRLCGRERERQTDTGQRNVSFQIVMGSTSLLGCKVTAAVDVQVCNLLTLFMWVFPKENMLWFGWEMD